MNPMAALMQQMGSAQPAPGAQPMPDPAALPGAQPLDPSMDPGMAAPPMGEALEPGMAPDLGVSEPEGGEAAEPEDTGEIPPHIQAFLDRAQGNPAELVPALVEMLMADRQQVLSEAVPHMEARGDAEKKNEQMRQKFYKDHPDLTPHEDLVGLIAQSLDTEEHGLDTDGVLAEVAKRTKAKLNLKTAGPSLPEQSAVGGALGNGGAPEDDKLTKQVKRMQSALRQS